MENKYAALTGALNRDSGVAETPNAVLEHFG